MRSSEITLQDIGELPSSIVATLVAQDSASLRALRLSCKAAYGACITTHSNTSAPCRDYIQTGISRQTTYLSINTRVFLDTTDTINAPASLRAHTASEFLARHPGVTDLKLYHCPTEEQQVLCLTTVPNSFPHLCKLEISVKSIDDDEFDTDYFELGIDMDMLSCLPFLTHLTIDHCLLGLELSSALAKLQLLTIFDLSECTGIEELAISALHHLRAVIVCSTDMTALSTSNCLLLERLDASSSHELVSLSIEGCPSLSAISVHTCPQLLCLDLRACIALCILNVSGCRMLNSLQVSEPSTVRTMQAYGCKELTGVDIMACNSLEDLTLESSSTYQLDITWFSALRNLTVYNTPLLSLPPCPTLQELYMYRCSAILILDLVSYPQLKCLTLIYCNALSSLEVAHLWNLTSLSLSCCDDMTDLLISNCPALRTVKVRTSQLSRLSITNLPLLLDLSVCSDHQQSDECSELQLIVLHCPVLSNVLVAHPHTVATNLCQMGGMKKLDASKCFKLVELGLAGCTDLSELVLAGCSSLQRLDLSEATTLSSLNLEDCKSVILGSPRVMCSNTLTSLDLTFDGFMPSLSALPKLRQLQLTRCNELTTIDKNLGCAGIIKLSISSCCLLQHLDITSLQALEHLKVTNCRILCSLSGTSPVGFLPLTRMPARGSSLPNQHASSITLLHVTNCPSLLIHLVFYPLLTDLLVWKCRRLTSLAVQHCQGLTDLKIGGCPSLSKLDLYGAVLLELMELEGLHMLQCLNLARCNRLQSLSITDCQLTNLDVRSCLALDSLYMVNCKVLQYATVVDMPILTLVSISECPALAVLQLSGSKCLESLDLESNPLLAPLDLVDACKLDVKFLPADPTALCRACLLCEVTHGCIHGSSVHRVCSNCALKVAHKEPCNETMTLSCPICYESCHLAIFSNSWF